MAVPTDHALMRTFYLLPSLPSCDGFPWWGVEIDGRLAILISPLDPLQALTGGPGQSCSGLDLETSERIFTNIVMLALTMDYKKKIKFI